MEEEEDQENNVEDFRRSILMWVQSCYDSHFWCADGEHEIVRTPNIPDMTGRLAIHE